MKRLATKAIWLGAPLSALIPLLGLGCSGSDTELPLPVPAVEAGGDTKDGSLDASDAKDSAVGPDADAGECPQISFVKPIKGAKLTNADDKNADGCKDGLQYDVEVTTSAAEGTLAVLFANTTAVGSASVANGTAKFQGVTLESNGSINLIAQVGSSKCKATNSIVTECDLNAPTCSISKPVISSDHPALNGVPASQGGDRVSADGQPYQAAFQVTTSAETGTTVTLNVDGKDKAASAQVSNGVAAIAGVTLSPDGKHTVQATCTKQNGNTGSSASGEYQVDSTPPDLATSGVQNGQKLWAGDDLDPSTDGIQFDVCGTTTAPDAQDLSKDNYCVQVGTSSPACQPVTTSLSGKACVRLDCNAIGSATQDLKVVLYDWAGNSTTRTVSQISCDTTIPTVAIVSPLPYDPLSSSPVILNATKDKAPTTFGMQYDVVACTNALVGTPATLMQAVGAAAFNQTGSAVQVAVAQPGDGCAGGTPNVAKFADAVLAESNESADGSFFQGTKLRVDLAVGGQTVSSAVQEEWVDSTLPGTFAVSVLDPNTLTFVGCGALIQSSAGITTTVRAGCDSSIPIAAQVTYEDLTSFTSQPVVASGTTPIPGVALKTGKNVIAIVGTEPSGNAGKSADCTVTVGTPPVLAFVSPTQNATFNLASADASGNPGFQVDVQLTTNDTTDHVELSVGGQVVASATPVGNDVSFLGVTLPEADALQISATQVGPGGTANPTLTVRVDMHAPTAITDPASGIKDRRAASANLMFLAPSDYDPVTAGIRAASEYEIRYLGVAPGTNCANAITDATFGAATHVPPSGLPAGPGATDTRLVDSLWTGYSYCAGLRASDSAGNKSGVTAFPIIEPGWLSTTIDPPAGSTGMFGVNVLGDIDLDQDGYYDVAVKGEPNSVWIYYGSAAGLEATPSVQIIGPTGALFGTNNLVNMGNFDGSTEAPKPLPELGIDAGNLNNQGGFFVFSLPSSLHAASLTKIQISADGSPLAGTIGAHFVINTDGSAPFSASYFGAFGANVGDYDGDGLDDVVLGAPYYSTNMGRAFLIRGRAAPSLTTLTVPAGSEIEFQSNAGAAYLGYAIAAMGNSGLGQPGRGGVVLGAASANSNAGALYALIGEGVNYGDHLIRTVETSATVTVPGPSANAQLGGGRLDFIGDLDGDGYDDLVASNAAFSAVYLIYGGPGWGSMAVIADDFGSAGDRFPRYSAKVSLPSKLIARLNNDTRSDLAFNTRDTNGIQTQTVWVVNGRQKLTGTTGISQVGVRPTLPSGSARGFYAGLGQVAGADSWPDVLVGDRDAVGGGRVVVIY